MMKKVYLISDNISKKSSKIIFFISINMIYDKEIMKILN